MFIGFVNDFHESLVGVNNSLEVFITIIIIPLERGYRNTKDQ
jgi:hypothetical protein